jgi:hypothetical protein
MAVDPRRAMGIRKSEANAALERFFAGGGTAQCPAAQIGNYADTRNRYLNCKVEDSVRPGHGHFATKDNPLAVLMLCCGDYTTCDVWTLARDRDPILDRVRAAQLVSDSKETQAREVAAGLRVDDGEQAPDLPTSSRIELAAKIQQASVERHWSEGPKKKGEA